MKDTVIKFLYIFAVFMLAAALFAWIAAFGAAGLNVPALIAAVSLTLTGLGLAVFSFVKYFTAGKKTIAYRERILALPLEERFDGRAELETVRRNFAAHPPKKVAHGGSEALAYDKSYFDERVLKTGTICYGCIVMANGELWNKSEMTAKIMPAALIYSLDEYFADNPAELKKIAFAVFDVRKELIRDERRFFSNIPVPEALSGGREVYISAFMVYRSALPLGCLSDRIFPVIASPKARSAFIVDKKYWSDALLANVAHGWMGVDPKTRAYRFRAVRLPVREIDFRRELDAVRAKYLLDPTETVEKVEFTKVNAEAYFDPSVLKTGRIVYGYLVQAISELFDGAQADIGVAAQPAVILYSFDELYEEQPLNLAPIARRIFSHKAGDILKDEYKYFSNLEIPKELTDGNTVYMSTIMIHRGFLPLGYLTAPLLPVIASPGETASFVVDKKFWTDDLTANFLHNFGQDLWEN